jgi:predicted DNA-binding transcriptional regulator YafY
LRPKQEVALRKEPTTRLLHLARQFAAEPAGISLDEIITRFSVSRRTAERMRDAFAEVFPQLEEIEGERPKRWRQPNSLSNIFREPLADELATLRGVARHLANDGLRGCFEIGCQAASSSSSALASFRSRVSKPSVNQL